MSFKLIEERTIEEVGGVVKLWQHNPTGAQVLSVCNDDENKCFGVNFRTPPNNSTGVAHILEHSVLCGSKNYPVKEPFVELLKSSLQTFLNAMTFPDKTCYPVASTNLQDLYNLIDVYLDAVFFPRIEEDVLAQEGWHIHVDETEKKWIFKGVVLNEMKGVYSSPDSVLAEKSMQSLFPDTLYSLDSGGDPEVILDLTFEEFKDFHTRYYHPSNARFFFWGDDPEAARLERLDTALKHFSSMKIDSSIPLQKPLDVARKLTFTYAVDELQENGKDAHVTVNWLLCEGKDDEEIMLLEMLEHILIGLPGSPLRKELMDSGFGEDITGSGLETDLRQAFFSLGLRSINPKDSDAIEKLILDTLQKIVNTGVSQKEIEGALSSLEFLLRENNTGGFPRGLSAMIQSLSTWLYDGDPFLPIAWKAPLNSIKKRLADGEKVFENAIEKWFLNNTHRVRVLLVPDVTLAEQRKEKEDARLKSIHTGMSKEKQATVARLSANLIIAQEKADAPEALATIPSLLLEDLPTKGKTLPCKVMEKTQGKILHHELETVGILYAKILLPMDNLKQELFPFLSLFCRSLTEMGTQKYNFVELGLEISAQTGGLGSGAIIRTPYTLQNPEDMMCYLQISGKAIEEKIPALCGLMEEILTKTSFDNKERFLQMVLEEKARMEQSLIPAGHSVLESCLAGMFSPSGYLGEIVSGIPYLTFVRELVSRVENDYESIKKDLLQIRDSLVGKLGYVISLTGDANLLAKAGILTEMVENLPEQSTEIASRFYPLEPKPVGLLVPAQVNYVGLGSNLNKTGYTYNGSALVIMRFLRMGYLWDRVRVQGGAYGAFVRYSHTTGSIKFLSYRDPNVARTLGIYKNAAKYLGNLELSSAELTKTIVGAFGDLETYLLPGAKGNIALWRYMTGYKDELRQQIRDELLSTTLSQFHDFAFYLQKALDTATSAALGGPAVTDYAKEQGWATIKLI